MKHCRLQPGHLNTRDERREMRWLAEDLQRMLDRTPDTDRRATLERQLDAIKREQAYDRQVSPRKTAKAQPKRGRRGGR